MVDDQIRGEINRLYWGSDSSVGDIADQLGISRRALYDNIDPRPAGALCPDCGAELGFRNRTAADRREVSCAACGSEHVLDGDPGDTPQPDGQARDQPGAGAGGPAVEQQERGARLSPIPPRPVPGTISGPVLGSALVAGLAAGAAVGYLIRRS